MDILPMHQHTTQGGEIPEQPVVRRPSRQAIPERASADSASSVKSNPDQSQPAITPVGVRCNARRRPVPSTLATLAVRVQRCASGAIHPAHGPPKGAASKRCHPSVTTAAGSGGRIRGQPRCCFQFSPVGVIESRTGVSQGLLQKQRCETSATPRKRTRHTRLAPDPSCSLSCISATTEPSAAFEIPQIRTTRPVVPMRPDSDARRNVEFARKTWNRLRLKSMVNQKTWGFCGFCVAS